MLNIPLFLKSCGWINRAGSILAICTNDVSVELTDRLKIIQVVG